MALQRIETDAIEDDAVTTAKIAANAVAAADIAANAITNAKVASNAAIAVSKVSGLGTAAALNVGTSANNIVQLDGSAKLPAVDGSNLTGVATDTSAMENNIAVLAFKTQAANNLAKFNLIDQVVDEYKDDTGLQTQTNMDRVGDTATEGFVASIGTIDTVTIPAAASDYTGDTGSYTETSGGLNVTTGDDSVRSVWTASGDFTVEVRMLGTTNQGIGIYATNEDGTFASNDRGGLQSMTNSWYYHNAYPSSATAGKEFGKGGSFEGTTGANKIPNNALCKFTRTSGTFKFYVDGTLTHTWSGTYTGAVRFAAFNSGTTAGELTDIKFIVPGSYSNAAGTLVSTSATALSAPTTGDICMLIENNEGTATLNTDLKAYVSRNGGTGWDQATLVDKGSWGTNKKIVTANNVAFSNSASGTDMRYKLEWANQVAGTSAGYQSGDRSSSITVTTTITEATGTVAKLVDGNAPTDNSHGAGNAFYWANGSNNVAGQELKFQFSSAQTITGAKMLSANSDSQGTWKWQGSNDGSSWTDIGSNFDFDTASSLTFDTNFGSQLSGNTTAYTYYRMYGVSGSTNGTTWWIEIEFYHTGVAGKVTRVHATSLAWA